MLHAFLPAFFEFKRLYEHSPFFNESAAKQHLEEARTQFQLYGHSDETRLMETFVSALQAAARWNDAAETKDAFDNLKELTELVKSRIRQELEIKK